MQTPMVALLICCAALAAPVAAPRQPDVYRVAYERWRDALDANPILDVPGWLRTDGGPPAVRTAVENLVSFGPNLVPFLVSEVRRETDQLRLYRLILLLNRVSGINLYFDSGYENFFEAVPQFKARFLDDWDAGNYANASSILRRAWKDPARGKAESIDPKSLTPIFRYGIFAVPFIAETLQKQDSPHLFAAFLNVTGQMQLYLAYLKSSSTQFTTRDQKFAAIKQWAAKNEAKVDKLGNLHTDIKALARGPARP